jgi:hypothetical protein
MMSCDGKLTVRKKGCHGYIYASEGIIIVEPSLLPRNCHRRRKFSHFIE